MDMRGIIDSVSNVGLIHGLERHDTVLGLMLRSKGWDLWFALGVWHLSRRRINLETAEIAGDGVGSDRGEGRSVKDASEGG